MEKTFVIKTEYSNGVPYVSCDVHCDDNIVYEVVDEEEMMKFIRTCVDTSSQQFTFNHIGENEYEMQVPKKDLYWMARIDGFRIEFVIRRPYDPECPQDKEYIYDVYMKDENNMRYVESLECVSDNILAHIYCDFKGM